MPRVGRHYVSVAVITPWRFPLTRKPGLHGTCQRRRIEICAYCYTRARARAGLIRTSEEHGWCSCWMEFEKFPLSCDYLLSTRELAFICRETRQILGSSEMKKKKRKKKLDANLLDCDRHYRERNMLDDGCSDESCEILILPRVSVCRAGIKMRKNFSPAGFPRLILSPA